MAKHQNHWQLDWISLLQFGDLLENLDCRQSCWCHFIIHRPLSQTVRMGSCNFLGPRKIFHFINLKSSLVTLAAGLGWLPCWMDVIQWVFMLNLSTQAAPLHLCIHPDVSVSGEILSECQMHWQSHMSELLLELCDVGQMTWCALALELFPLPSVLPLPECKW